MWMLSFVSGCGIRADWQCWAWEQASLPWPSGLLWRASRLKFGVMKLGISKGLRQVGYREPGAHCARGAGEEALALGLIVVQALSKHFSSLPGSAWRVKWVLTTWNKQQCSLGKSQLAVWKIGLIRHRNFWLIGQLFRILREPRRYWRNISTNGE